MGDSRPADEHKVLDYNFPLIHVNLPSNGIGRVFNFDNTEITSLFNQNISFKKDFNNPAKKNADLVK